MRKTAIRQLELLEREERSRKLERDESLAALGFSCLKLVFAHYLGGLTLDDEDPGEAEARALNYQSRDGYLKALLSGEQSDIKNRFKNAARRLFAAVGLNFDRSPPPALFKAFIGMLNELPDHWLNWLKFTLQQECPAARLAAGSNMSLLPIALGGLSWRRTVLRNFRVFTRTKALFLPSVEDLIREESKACFWVFRRCIHPTMKCSWWQHEVADELQRFYHRLKKGERPKLALMAPPQHGKTELVKDFTAWVAGKRPDLKTIFASYSDELGADVNKALQRIMASERYVSIFGVRLGESGSRWVRNSNTLEYPYHGGSFYNTTVEGQITGKGLDLGIVDDPVKGRAEASSKSVRDKVWGWFTDDFFTRFSDSAGLLMIMTRWHLDDPVGRLIERFPDAKVFRYPAIAEEDEKNRRKGEALFPEHKSLEFLLERKRAMAQASWESEYQQNPIIAGGGMFPIEKITVLSVLPDARDVVSAARYWDKAGTAGGGAYSAGVLMLRMRDGTFVVRDVRRGQWSALDRERIIKQTAAIDREHYPFTKIYIEQEGGSGGKES